MGQHKAPRKRQSQRSSSRTARPTTDRAWKQQRKGRSIGPIEIAAGIGVLVIIGILATVAISSHTSKATEPKSLAPTIDGVKCQADEQLVYHIHQFLAVYDQGKRVLVPGYIGIPGGANASCYYWIHTHALADYPSGVIHVESPIQRTYTLEQFFDIWQRTQPKNSFIIGALKHAAARHSPPITIYVNGHLYHGGYRSIPLRNHETIYIELGHPLIKPKPFDFAKYQL
jgi:hypothetical protein